MKKILTYLAAIIILAIPVLGQESKDNPTKENEEFLFSGNITHGGYGGPEFRLAQIDGQWGRMSGGRGGWIINSQLSIGGGGYGFTSKLNFGERNDTSFSLNVGYGGVFVEYIDKSNKLMHFTINALIGGGEAKSVITNVPGKNYNEKTDYRGNKSTFYIFEPGASVDFNVFSFCRVGVGCSYKIVSDLSLKRPDGTIFGNKDLNGFSANLILKFGGF